MYGFISNLDREAVVESSELRALTEVWLERKGHLQRSGEYHEFVKKMQREWAIETGLIERLYTWDRGVTELLIEQGIEASLIAHRGGLARSEAEHVSSIIRDQRNVIEGLWNFIKGEQFLTEHYIRSMHAEFTAHQDFIDAKTPDGRSIQVQLLKGEYKQQPNNPLRPDGQIHEYCPPEHVHQEMNNLVFWYGEWEQRETSAEVLSAFLHHRFTQIHPFQDGNGRVARALASIVFLKRGLFPLVIRDIDREQYIQCLEQADCGDLQPLCNLFARNQRNSILVALGIEQGVQQARHAEEILTSGLQLLRDQFQVKATRMNGVFSHAEVLCNEVNARLSRINRELEQQLPSLTPPGQISRYSSRSDSSGNDSVRRQWFRNQIVSIAERYKYYANFNNYCSWALLSIQSVNQFQFVVAFHGFGSVHKGIMAASSFTLYLVPREGEQGGTEPIDVHPASPDFFQFNYAEPIESVKGRFNEWLEGSLAMAMAEWRRSLARLIDVG